MELPIGIAIYLVSIHVVPALSQGKVKDRELVGDDQLIAIDHEGGDRGDV